MYKENSIGKFVEIEVKGTKVTITPEYFVVNIKNLEKIAKGTEGVFIGSYCTQNHVSVAVFEDGRFIGKRHKYRLTQSEVSHKFAGKFPPTVVTAGGLRILPIICYELLYPKDYLFPHRQIDLVTHQVYSVMFDLCQYEGWKAMYHTLSAYFDCPVITACGKPSRLGLNKSYEVMDVSGIVRPEDKSEDFLHKKFDEFRKI